MSFVQQRARGPFRVTNLRYLCNKMLTGNSVSLPFIEAAKYITCILWTIPISCFEWLKSSHTNPIIN